MKKSVLLAVAVMLTTAVPAQALSFAPEAVPQRSEMALVYDSGAEVATANAHEARDAMSLSKLFLAHWVLHHGSLDDAAKVETMIRFSDDYLATVLDRRYPQAIPETIAAFGLGETTYNGYWGYTTTTAHDVARFLQAVRYDPISAPMISGMLTASPVAADGYAQDYGTSRIPGVQGTKFGWSDGHDVNGSASIGPGYSVAIITFGSASDTTEDTLAALRNDSSPFGEVNAAGLLKSKIRCRVTQTSSDAFDQALPDSTPIPAEILRAFPNC